MAPYREGQPPSELNCPRCNKPLPALDIAPCSEDCGTWVSADAAAVIFAPEEVVENRLTRWWRVRAPCPRCGEKMTLRGFDVGLFQGCTQHGYFVDADTISQTGLARPGLTAEVERARERRRRAQDAKVEAEKERERREAEEQAKEAERIALREAAATRRERDERARLRDAMARRVRALIETGDVMPVVDELLRLEDMIVQLAERVTELEDLAEDV